MTDSGVSPRGSGESRVRVLCNGYHRMLQNLVSQMNKLQCTEESGLAQNHEADSVTDRTQVQYFLSGQSGEWKHSRPSWCLQAPYHLPLLATAAEQLLPSRATVLHLRLPTDQRCSTAPQAGRQDAMPLCTRGRWQGVHPRQEKGH